MSRLSAVVLAVLLALLSGGLTPPVYAQAFVDQRVFAQLAASPTGEADVLVLMSAKADLTRAATMPDRASRGDAVAAALKATAERSQASVLNLLGQLQRQGFVSRYRAFFSVNVVAVTGGEAAVAALAGAPGVARIEADDVVRIPDLNAVPTARPGVEAAQANIKQIKANKAWALGFRGQGIIVGIIDTGGSATHEALAAGYRCRGGADDNCWFDVVNGMPAPYDDNGHGMHLLGTAAGRLGIGVAKSAKWVACKAFDSGGAAQIDDIIACSDFFLGRPARFRPDVINNSWGAGRGQTFFNDVIDAWNAAGIHSAFSVGASGPGCGGTGSPAEYTNAFGVGAVDADDMIASFSSRGPASAINGGSIKPDVVGPGINIRSAYGCDTCYAVLSGTSMATAHTTGTLALVLSKNPGLSVAAARMIVENSALDRSNLTCGGTADDNNVYGEGRLDALAAVNATP